MSTELIFLGADSCRPTPGGDTASLFIGGRLLVDTGWNAAGTLAAAGVRPESVDYLAFTHLHHDHCLGLCGLLYCFLSTGRLPRLTILGPEGETRAAIDRALRFLQAERYWPDCPLPQVVELAGGQSFCAPGFELRTLASRHAVPGLCYRFRAEDGADIGLSGDTAYTPELGPFFAGCQLLVHECSLGSKAADPQHNPALHSGALDAARVAFEAGAGALALVHGPADRKTCARAAHTLFSGPVLTPRSGERLFIC